MDENPYEPPSSEVAEPDPATVFKRLLPKPAGRVIRAISALASPFFGLYSIAALSHLDSFGTLISFVVFAFFTVELGSIALTGYLYPKRINQSYPV